jgi:AcrR family transcriptional regulator
MPDRVHGAALFTAGGSADGRNERSRRTHERLVQAVIELVQEGDRRPTAQSVANRAGIALRTLYHHFADVEDVRLTALQVAWRRHVAALPKVRPDRPFEDRVRTVVRHLGRLYETMTPVGRAEPPAGESLSSLEIVRPARQLLRSWLADAFAAEIEAAGITAPVLLDALDTAMSWDSWDCLRSDLGRSATAARRTFELVLRNLFTCADSPR